LHVSVLADRGEQVGCLEELLLRDASDLLDHFRCVARVLLLQQLKDAARVLQGEVVRDVRWHRRRWSCFCLSRSRPYRASCLMALASAATTAGRILPASQLEVILRAMLLCALRLACLRVARASHRGGRRGQAAQVAALLIIPGRFVIHLSSWIEPREQTVI